MLRARAEEAEAGDVADLPAVGDLEQGGGLLAPVGFGVVSADAGKDLALPRREFQDTGAAHGGFLPKRATAVV